MRVLEEYKICKANSEEWSRYHAIYRLSNFNEWMPMSFQGELNRYNKLELCYWITKNNKKVGGALIKSNMIKCIFTIPPFKINEEIIKELILYVSCICDMSEDIIIPDADLKSIECYEMIGFELQRVDKLMVCATDNYDIIWDKQYSIVIPEEKYAQDMTKLYYETYRKNKLEYISTQSYEYQEQNVKSYFNHRETMNAPVEWSTLVYDSTTNKLIGACIVSLVYELPYILDFVVHPEYQRKGLATNMIKRTLDIVASNYPAIRLNVTVGNDAEQFYGKMGFVSLAEKAYVKLNKKRLVI